MLLGLYCYCSCDFMLVVDLAPYEYPLDLVRDYCCCYLSVLATIKLILLKIRMFSVAMAEFLFSLSESDCLLIFFLIYS